MTKEEESVLMGNACLWAVMECWEAIQKKTNAGYVEETDQPVKQ